MAGDLTTAVKRSHAGVVIIEDNPADAFLMEEALREYGVPGPVTILSTADDALKYFSQLEEDAKATYPVAVLLELSLPKYSGREVLSRIRSGVEGASVPVVIVSNCTGPEAYFPETSVTSYFRKTGDFCQMLEVGAVLKTLVGRQGASR